METTTAERVLLRRPVLGSDGRLQSGSQVAQYHGGDEQETTQDPGQGEERPAIVFRRSRGTVVDILGHDYCVLDILLKLGEVGRVPVVNRWRLLLL